MVVKFIQKLVIRHVLQEKFFEQNCSQNFSPCQFIGFDEIIIKIGNTYNQIFS